MLAREDKSDAKHREVRKKTSKVAYGGAAVIFINYSVHIVYAVYILANNYDLKKLNRTFMQVTWKWIPLCFYLVEDACLVIGLLWICKSLQKNRELMGNEKYMALHAILLVASTITSFFALGLNFLDHQLVLVGSIAAVMWVLVVSLMAFIMNQVNST